MPLTSSIEGQTFPFLKELVRAVNEHAEPEGYAVVIARIKKFKLRVKRKTWLRCDREEKFATSSGETRRHFDSRLIECPFSLTVKREDDDVDAWILKIVISQHNHESIIADAHSILRRMIITSQIRSDVTRQLIVQTASFKILFTLRIDSVSESVATNSFESVAINFMIKPRDIYNLKAQLRREELDPLTFVQALIRGLDQEDWVYEFQKNAINQITHLFFVKGTSQNLLKTNSEIIVMNCIYKINRYKMLLLIISAQTALHTNFYVIFCFMIKERANDYRWAMKQLKILYLRLKLFMSVVFVIDMKRVLMIAVREIFSTTNHLLCTWHINNNVLVNCKKSFATKKDWETFFKEWKSIMYASFDAEYWRIWEEFSDTYLLSHDECVEYLLDTYLRDYRRRFIKCYIDQILHFETTMTSRDESEHSVLKRQLRTSTRNLKTVMNEINLLLINEIHNHLIVFDEIKTRLFNDFRKSVFQRLIAYITSYALRQIYNQYKLMIDRATAISRCTHVFTTTIDLSCSHKIQERMYQEDESLLLKNVHHHWR